MATAKLDCCCTRAGALILRSRLRIARNHGSPWRPRAPARAHGQVKTTAPKRYCVRPNCCLVRAGEQVEVKIIMQALKEIPPADQMWKDKFLIQVIQAECRVCGKAERGERQ